MISLKNDEEKKTDSIEAGCYPDGIYAPATDPGPGPGGERRILPRGDVFHECCNKKSKMMNTSMAVDRFFFLFLSVSMGIHLWNVEIVTDSCVSVVLSLSLWRSIDRVEAFFVCVCVCVLFSNRWFPSVLTIYRWAHSSLDTFTWPARAEMEPR